MLRIEDVGKTYPNGTVALSGLRLNVGQAEIVAVVGGSGCGKSTLMRIVAGLDLPTKGRVRLGERTITEPAEQIGLIFQEPRLLPWLTVGDNVAFAIRHLPATERRARVERLLADVHLPGHAGRWPKELSGGQAQRVAIARALAPEPDILLLDEPFSALDAFTRAELQDHLVELWRLHRRTFVLVTHDIEEAVALADRVVVMRPHPGRVAAELALDLPRPRDRLSDDFARCVRDVRLALGETINPPGRPGPN